MATTTWTANRGTKRKSRRVPAPIPVKKAPAPPSKRGNDLIMVALYASLLFGMAFFLYMFATIAGFGF